MEVWTVFRLSDNAIAGHYATEEEAANYAARLNAIWRQGGFSQVGEIWVVGKGEECDPNLYGPDP